MAMFDRFWITRIFADEFGFSDLRSNYSRVYSWMANQLGHMTLGLALTLFFFWIHNTIVAVAKAPTTLDLPIGAGMGLVVLTVIVLWGFGTRIFDWFEAFSWTTIPNSEFFYQALFVLLIVAPFAGVFASASPEGWSVDDSVINGLLLGAAAGVMACGGILAILAIAFKDDEGHERLQPPQGRARGYVPVSRTMRLVALVAVLAPGLAAWVSWLLGPFDVSASLVASILATTLYGLIIVYLSRDIRFAVLGLVVLLGVVVTAAGDELATLLAVGLTRADIGFYGAILFSVLTVGLLIVWRQRSRPFDLFFYAIWGVTLGFAFWWLTTRAANPEWDVARAAAIASMTVWTMKEFSSDLPNVFDELADVDRQRPPLFFPDWPPKSDGVPRLIHDDGQRLSGDYVNTAMWDVRTDAAFYLAGAWIGAGVLTNFSLLFEGSTWAVGTELVGLLIFGFFFIAGGRNWAYRQKAIDQSGAGRGNMLAVVPFATELWCLEDGTLHQPLEEPRSKLRGLARGRVLGDGGADVATRNSGHDAKPWHVDHLLVIGPPRLNQQFADAMVTEAMLTDLPPQMFAGLDKEPTWRRARKLDLALLERYEIANLTKAELPYAPLWDVDYSPRAAMKPVPGDDTLRPLERRSIVARPPGMDDVPDIPSANLAVVTGYMPNTRDLRRGLRTIFGKDHATRIETVVWTFASARLPAAAEDPDLPALAPGEGDAQSRPYGTLQAETAVSIASADLLAGKPAAPVPEPMPEPLPEPLPEDLRPWPDPSPPNDIRAIAADWAGRFQAILDTEMASAEIDRPHQTKLALVILRSTDPVGH